MWPMLSDSVRCEGVITTILYRAARFAVVDNGIGIARNKCFND